MKECIVDNAIISEWDFKSNDLLGLDPHKLTIGSNKKAWWICKKCGNKWFAKIENRALLGRGCPECAKRLQTSSQEMKIYYYIKKYFPSAISRYSNLDIGITEIDVYMPELHIGIEYDGGKWHQDINKDKNKDNLCELNGLSLIRVREPKCPIYDSSCKCIRLKNRSLSSLRDAIFEIFQYIGMQNIDIDFARDMNEINELISCIDVSNSLSKIFPQIAKEWHPTKNGKLTPENVYAHSSYKVWWKCDQCGYEYLATVDSRTGGKHCGCPECKREKIRVAQSVPVYCAELDRMFVSSAEAHRQTGISQGHISSAANGKRKYAGKHPITGAPLTRTKIDI